MPIQNTPGASPTEVILHTCSIAGHDYRTIVNGTIGNRFHVQELRIYEDNCKFYFTGQLVIEAQQNVFERFLAPQAEVVISFQAPPNNFLYTERFRVFSYESKPREGDLNHSMIVTISLIGEEYFKDKATQVQMNFTSGTATNAARIIHEQLATNGSVTVPLDSTGMVGQQFHAHQVLSKKPSKAIHDLLDKAIFPPVPMNGPGVYFRNKSGYVIAPIGHLMQSAPITGTFYHYAAGGYDMNSILSGYDLIIHFRPMSPPGEDRGSGKQNKAFSFVDMMKGNSQTGKGAGGTGYAGGVSKYILDSLRQLPTVDKNGPGDYQSQEDEFITRLTYSPKYWVSVPMQTGIDVTVGDRITINYGVADERHTKTIWIARLIHEIRLTAGRDRTMLSVNGTTDLYGVEMKL